MLTLQECIDAWNAEADENNQWDELGADEKCEWCLNLANYFCEYCCDLVPADHDKRTKRRVVE
jgi:hypothetical protein